MSLLSLLSLLASLGGCSPEKAADPVALFEYPSPDAWEPLAGPAGPAVTFAEAELWQHCAYLTGGPEDIQHHNLAVVRDGYLWLPWAPEDGGGGLTIFEFSDPCNPVKVGEAYAEGMRESHTMAFGVVDGREYLAVDYHTPGADGQAGGVGFWDVTDRTDPRWVSAIELPDYDYPDAYFRVVLSTTWQGDVLYAVAGLNGVFAIDVSDPLSPELVSQTSVVAHIMGTLHVVGNIGLASSAGLAQTTFYDLSDPWSLEPIAGGDWQTEDREGDLQGYYFASLGGEYALFARNTEGGGPIIYDVTDPTAPAFVGDHFTPDADGGYVFRHNDWLFQGESNFGAVYDITDPTDPVLFQTFDLQGDLDTVTPVGNVAVISVDDDANDGQSTAVMPWDVNPDALGPTAKLVNPADGETFVTTLGRIGVSFDEMIEHGSVFEGSFRVWTERGEPVAGRFNTQENIVNFTPDEPLEADTTYLVSLPAGGVTDVSGNPTEVDRSWVFSTGGDVNDPRGEAE